MQNVAMQITGSKLIITCDLEAQQTPSSTGKTLIVASTQGNQSLPGKPNFKLGLNLYTK